MEFLVPLNELRNYIKSNKLKWASISGITLEIYVGEEEDPILKTIKK